MPKLIFVEDKESRPIDIPWALNQPITIGADGHVNDCSQEPETTDPSLCQVTIVKLPESPSYVLLEQAGSKDVTYINGMPVPQFKITRHGDRIVLGGQLFLFNEFEQQTLEEDSAYLQGECPVVMPHRFEPSDQVVVCRCGKVSHLRCWLIAERCAKHDCAYAHRDLLVKSLQRTFIFETLTSSSPLIGKICKNPSKDFPWDKNPFHAGGGHRQPDRIAYCPKCKMPYHETCWLSFETCPTTNCGYKVRERVLEFFAPAK